GMGRGKDTVRRHLWRAVLQLMKPAHRTEFLTVPLELHLRASLAVDALKMAISARAPVAGSLIHHSDRGVQYACSSYSDILHAHGIQPSMSRVGNPYDNARAESFMKTLKQEEVAGLAYRDSSDARRRELPINICDRRILVSLIKKLQKLAHIISDA
ncbi:transposase, partial [Sinorhizobium meliloti]|uniref:DDE-type integrase/transposase/recombinase n=1 Tax=Rhizobium meliloti TaxID=382 RepID=UPI000FE0B1C7